MIMRRVVKFFALTFIVIIGLSGIVAGGMAAWLYNQGGLNSAVNSYLQERFQSVNIGFNEIDWTLDTAQPALIITGKTVKLEANEQSVEVPAIDLVFTPVSLIKQMPSAVIIDTDSLSVTHTAAGWQFGQSSAFEGFGYNFLSQMGEIWPDGLLQLRIRVKELFIIGDDEDEPPVRFQNVRLIAAPEGGVFANGNVSLTIGLNQHSDAGQIVPHLNFAATANLFSGLIEFNLDMQVFRMAALASHLTPYTGQLPIDIGMLTASLSGAYDSAGLQILSGSIGARDGKLGFAVFSELGKSYNALDTEFDYSAADNALKISKASLQMADGKSFALSAKVNGVRGARAMLTAQLLGEDIAVRDILKKWPSTYAPELRQFISKNSAGGRLRTIAVQLAGGLDWQQQQLDISSLGVSGEVSNLRLSYKDAQYQSIVGTLGGQFEMEMGAGGEISEAKGSLSLRDGFARVSGFAPTVKIPRLDAVWRHQPQETILQNLFVDFEQYGQVLASGKRYLVDGIFETEINLNLPEMDFEFSRHLWPARFAKVTTSWMSRHLKGGRITDGQLAFVLSEQAGKMRTTKLEGSLPFSQLSYQLHKGMMPVEELRGQINFADNMLSGNFEAGKANTIRVEQAQISYGPLLNFKGSREIEFKTLASGDVTDVLEILDHPRINQIDKLGLRPFTIKGQSRFTLAIMGEVPLGGRFKLADISVDGTLSDADIDGLPLDQHLQDSALVISAKKGETQISGSGRLSGIDSDFNYRRLPDNKTELQLKLANSEALPKFISARIGWPLTGGAAARLNITGLSGSQDVKVNIRSDVTDLGVQHDSFEWAKLQGESGFINAQLVFEDGHLTTIEAIDIETGSLRAKGRMTMDEKGVPSFGLLEDLVFPGTELKSVLFQRSGDASLSFTAEGKTLNLQPLRRDDQIKEGQDIRFDITADRIIVGPKLSFSGALTGQTRPDGNGEASLQGAVYVNAKLLVSEASLQTSFGPQGEYLQGVGLIGGGEAELSYKPSKEAGATLIIRSEKAGRVLAGLGVTDAIRRGKLQMQTNFSDASFERYSTQFEIDDFVVIEAPAAVRMFSVLSLAGLYGLVEGEGTAFARGEALIHSDGEMHELERVQAGGAALGISLLGQVNRGERTLDVSGNLVPANLVSTIIGSVPLVAEILTGVDRTGLFATQFSMQGSIDDPDVSVNALALAPGLLRDIFSPNWLGAERERIFGKDAQN